VEASDIPYKIPAPFASSNLSNATVPIPTAAQPNGFASWAEGWGIVNATNPSAGGIPPRWQDFLGLFYICSAWLQWTQAGGAPVAYDGAFQATIGGYPNGAVVASGTTAGLYWRSTADNNTSNPDTGGTNWVPFPGTFIQDNYFGPGSSNPSWNTHGTYTIPVPVWATHADIDVWGAGGGAMGSNQGSTINIGSSGAGCGYANSQGVAVTPGSTLTIIVGQGGIGTTGSSGTRAGNGGTSSVSGAGITTISAIGGTGGGSGPGPGGSGIGGTVNLTGQGGTDLDGLIGPGGSCMLAPGGNAPSGGLGGIINAAGTGTPATSPGGGGGANYYVDQGQSGADGGVRIVFYP